MRKISNAARFLFLRLQKHWKYTAKHSQRVAEIAQMFGRSKEEKNLFYLCGLFHDIGKLKIPTGLLQKKEQLNKNEIEMLKLHTLYGRDILYKQGFNNKVINSAYQHHERCNGNGYPDQITEIPYIVRVIAVADIYTALTEDRPYRPALSQQEASKILLNYAQNGEIDMEITKHLLGYQHDILISIKP
jgi:putative nucleotidyltransferase with HDIG domain